MTSLDANKHAIDAKTEDSQLPPAYRRWRMLEHLNPNSLSHVIASGLLRRLVTQTIADSAVTRKSYAEELSQEGVPISSPTVARAASELIEHRLVRDGRDVLQGHRGRAEKRLELVPFVIGVSVSDAPEGDVKFTTTSQQVDKSRAVVVHAVATGLDGRPTAAVESVTVDFHSADSEAVRNAALVQAIVNVLLTVKWDYWRGMGAHLLGVGIMIGGQVHNHRVVHHSPNIGLDQKLDLPALIAEEVDARRLRTNGNEETLKYALTELAPAPILVENDADAHARYRAWFGAHGRETPMHYVLILLKIDGLGGSIASEGRAGAMLPFEIGHTVADTTGKLDCRCGNYGCLEAVVTPRGMAKQLGLEEEAGYSARAMSDLFFQKLQSGDTQAQAIFDRGAAALGYAIANIMSLGSPDVIYISAPNELHDDRFTSKVEKIARAHTFPGVRKQTAIVFESATSHDDDATAAVAQVVEHTVEKFERASTP